MNTNIKHDLICSFKNLITEDNIEELIDRLRLKLNNNFCLKLIIKGYKFFECYININSKKLNGFGRTKFEALFNCLINLIDILIEDNNSKIIDILSNFTKDNIQKGFITEKDSNFINNNDDEENETKMLISLINNEKKLILCHVDNFSFYPNQNNNLKEKLLNLSNDIKEKNLIFKELEKVIYDMQNKFSEICELIKKDLLTCPEYFKCPISWEILNNPVISNEGHSYEKWAIEKWLSREDISPITGLPLSDFTLLPNYCLKNALDDFNNKKKKWIFIKDQIIKFIIKSQFDFNDLKKYFYVELKN